jgi:serine phosphatase RsbU (regulator of sigma subunit)
MDKTLFVPASAPVAPPVRFGHFLGYVREGEFRRLRIGPQGVVIGREEGCDIVVPVSEVSRRHCQIQLQADGVVAYDLGSTNGTYVGGQRLTAPLRLANGSHIAVGPALFRYEQRDEREIEEDARLSAELRQAVEYVRVLLPEPISSGPVLAEWWYAPSSELGGDAFGYHFLDADTLFGFLIDVTGHGIGAGMHAANVANVLRRRALPGVDFRDPGQVAQGLNAMFPMEEHGGLMFTLWCFVYHLDERTLDFCAAGHHPSFLSASDASEPQPLWLRAPTVGMLPARSWPTERIRIPPGSRLYIFSDGAFEIVDAGGAQWRIENLRQLIAQAPPAGLGEAQRLYQSVRAAARAGPLGDDFSALVLHFT